MESRIAEVKEKEELSNLRPPVSGDDIMKLFNLKPGPSVGIIMKALYEQRLNEGEVSKEEAIQLAEDIFKNYNCINMHFDVYLYNDKVNPTKAKNNS